MLNWISATDVTLQNFFTLCKFVEDKIHSAHVKLPVAMRLPRDRVRGNPLLAKFGRAPVYRCEPDDLELVLSGEDCDGALGTEPHGLAFAGLSKVKLIALHLLNPCLSRLTHQPPFSS